MPKCANRIGEADVATAQIWTRACRLARRVAAVTPGVGADVRERAPIQRGALFVEESPRVGDNHGEVDEKRDEQRHAALDPEVLVGVLDFAVVVTRHIA